MGRRPTVKRHIKWWRIIGWLYLTGLLLYGSYIILTSLKH
ncbi:hypothetical protein C5L21_001081 [Leuconostoc citreum]|jgi:hypothetical protein|nr:hypothetical protein C5L21_001081 [Leuconostoc citreum]CCF25836.1 Protein of unknown function [Leuconostoc citreum LBAE C11]CCF28698.1 Protein of unknown function [Leuconostoc citreum LBAE E16]CDX64444.1 Protein of unknown function [Leuconostoc citreum]CDX66166.1 Protein of unknown function [Leuconostoc citreum]